MNKKQLLETAGIQAGNWVENLIPFKPRPRFGSGHFAFAVVLTFTFFTFPGTVYTATTTTISQSSQPDTKPRNQPSDQVMTPLTKAIEENNTVSDSRAEIIAALITSFAAVIAASFSLWIAYRNSKTQEKIAEFNRNTQTEITKLEGKLTRNTQTEIAKLNDQLTLNTQTEITKLESKLTGDMLRDARLEEHVFNSLQWLSGGTQKRSIGIAVIDANWENKKLSHLRETWISVLVAQAVYLLAEQDRKETKQRQHEITNANNILRILEKTVKETELLDNRHVKELERALAAREEEEKATKGNSKHGPELPEKSVEQWQKLANEINRILEKTAKETELLDDKQVKELPRALDAIKVDSKHRLELPEEVVKQWQKLVDDAKAKKKPQCWLRLFIS